MQVVSLIYTLDKKTAQRSKPMRAERGSSGIATLSRPSFSGREGRSLSRSIISSPRSNISRLSEFKPSTPNLDRQVTSFNFKNTKEWLPQNKALVTKQNQRTMSRQEFDAWFLPMRATQETVNDQLLHTRQFSTRRNEGTIERFSIDKIKQEIRTAKIAQPTNERRTIAKMQLYEAREATKQKISLIKSVNLKKRIYSQTAEPEVKLAKNVSLLKEPSTKPVDLFQRPEETKQREFPKSTTRPIERPLRFIESLPKKSIEKNLTAHELFLASREKKSTGSVSNKEIISFKHKINQDQIIKKRIEELLPHFGLKKTYHIVTQEGHKVTLETIFRIAIKNTCQLEYRQALEHRAHMKHQEKIQSDVTTNTQTEENLSFQTKPDATFYPVKTMKKISILHEIKTSIHEMVQKKKKSKKEQTEKLKTQFRYVVDKKAQAIRQNMVSRILFTMYFSKSIFDLTTSGKEIADSLPNTAPTPAKSGLAKLKNKENDGSYVAWRQQIKNMEEKVTFANIMGTANKLTETIPPVDRSYGKGREVSKQDVDRVLNGGEEAKLQEQSH